MDLTRSRRLVFSLIVAFASTTVVLICAEVLIRIFHPMVTLYPRDRFSPSYGDILNPNTVVVHELPGKWIFHYTVNGAGYHGREVPISGSYPIPNVVLLGDSYTFGEGGDDTLCFGAIMAERLRSILDS